MIENDGHIHVYSPETEADNPMRSGYINLLGLESLMLNAKFQDHRTFGCGKEDVLRFLKYMGVVAILVM